MQTSNITFFIASYTFLLSSIEHLERSYVFSCMFSSFFQAEITIMFNKMEEPKDFVTRLQVAKVMVSAYSASGRNRMRCLRKSKAELGSSVYKIVRQNVDHSAIKTTV